MAIKFLMGGGTQNRNEGPQSNQNMPQGTGQNAVGGGMHGMYPPMTPQSGNYPQQMVMLAGGQQPASGIMPVGYYDGNGGGGTERSARMGFIWDDPDPESMRWRGRRTRSEDDMPETEARHRSRRTGRFVRGEGNDDELVAHGGSRHDEGEGREERGSYSRQDGDDDMERLHRKIRKLEQRLEENEEAREQVRHLKKEVRRLKDALEDLKGDGNKDDDDEKQGKKKKTRGRDDEGDDEDDPLAGLRELLQEGVSGKAFLKHLPRIFQNVFQVIAVPPKTWPAYLEKGDYSGIYTMEAKELMKAIDGYKAGQKDVDAVAKEVRHTGAALIQLYAHLLHQFDGNK